jgi:hypothetical protein
MIGTTSVSINRRMMGGLTNTKDNTTLSLLYCWRTQILEISHSPKPNPNSFRKRKWKSYLRFHWAKSDPLEFINLLLLVVFLGNPRRARSPRCFRVVDFLRKVCESLKVTLKPTTSYWAPTSWKRLKEKKASFRSVWGSFVVTHTSSATTSFLEGSEHWYTCVSLAPVISI